MNQFERAPNSATLDELIFGPSMLLRSALSRFLLSLMATAGTSFAQQNSAPPMVTLSQLRNTAERGALTRVTGVVTWVGDHHFNIQDQTGALPVEVFNVAVSVEVGEEVEVTGKIAGMGTSLSLRNPQILKIGTRPLPDPEVTTVENLRRNGFAGRRIRLSGSLHDVAVVDGMVRMVLQGRNDSVTIWLPWTPRQQSSESLFNWLDALVEVTGVAQSGPLVEGNERGGRIMLSSREDLRVIKPGSADIFTRPLRTLAELKENQSTLGERFRTIGVVSYGSPAGWFYLQDGAGTGRAGRDPVPYVSSEQRRVVQSNPLVKPGDRVELVGYRVLGSALTPVMPWFATCEWRIIGKAPPPPFDPVNARNIMAHDFDGRPVSITAEVVNIQVLRDFAGYFNHYITVDDDGIRFLVLVQKKAAEKVPLHEGDYAQFDGVLFVERTAEGATTSFRLNVSDFPDIRPASRPWRALHLERWLLGGAGVALVAFVWIVLLRRQVRHQTARLRESSMEMERFKTVSDTTSDLIGMATLDGKPLYMNPAGRMLLGIGLDDDISRLSFADIYSPEAMELFQREGFRIGMEQGHWEAELNVMHRDGRQIPVSFVGLIIKAADGTPLYMGCSARDASARLKLERQLRESLNHERELNQLKTSFVNTISHEFRTPLGIILFAAGMMRRFNEKFSPAEREPQLTAIEEAVARMNDLVEQSLSLGRADAAQPEKQVFDARALCRRIVDEVMSSTSHCSQITLVADEESSEPACSDETMLRAILVNLVGNAVKYSPPGTLIVLSLTREDDTAIFGVRDHGPGLREEDMPSLFTTFRRGIHTAGIPGTGLGLAIVKRCAEALGGSVVARNAEGGGAEFIVNIPQFYSLPAL